MLAVQIFAMHFSESFYAYLNCNVTNERLTFFPIDQTLLHLSKDVENLAQFTFTCLAGKVANP